MVTVKGAVSQMTASEKKLQPLSAEEWEVAEEYVKIFKPFKVATAVMSASRYPTISMVIPELNKLKYCLTTGAVQSNSMPTLNEDLLASIHRRWPNYETKSVYAVSTIVDPRYKDCGFEDTSASDYAKSLVLKEMMLNVDRQVQLQREAEQCIPGQSTSPYL